MLVLGNLPWVTNSVQGVIGGNNLPTKSNFLGLSGFDAMTGKSNFDISESMILGLLDWLKGMKADIALLVKSSVARKVVAHAMHRNDAVESSFTIDIDAKRNFGVSVSACLLVIRLDPAASPTSEYTTYASLDDRVGVRIGHRRGMPVSNLSLYDSMLDIVGQSPQKWRSGIKHDASDVMELRRANGDYTNGLGQSVDLEDAYLYPLVKGSEIGSSKDWRERFVLVTQRRISEPTNVIQTLAPKTWGYLQEHAGRLDSRGSSIYRSAPRFAIFGVGDYAFKPWKIAICGLYKSLNFRLIGPIEDRPVMLDDTVYFVSFDSQSEAVDVLRILQSKRATDLFSSLIFWDDKRPIKTSILNSFDWSKIDASGAEQFSLI